MEKEIKELQVLAAGMEAETFEKVQQPTSHSGDGNDEGILDMFHKIIYGKNNGEGVSIGSELYKKRGFCEITTPKRYDMMTIIVGELKNHVSVGDILNEYKITIEDLVILCEDSDSAKLEIVRQGYGFSLLSRDNSSEILLEIVKHGYWDDNLNCASSAVKKEAIRRGMNLKYFALYASFNISIAALAKLLQLHSYDLYENAMMCIKGREPFKPVIRGLYYEISPEECLEIVKRASLYREILTYNYYFPEISNLV